MDSTTFTYDANGTRLTGTRVEGSTTTVKTYSVPSGGQLTAVCRTKATEGLWTLYRELRPGEKGAALGVIGLLENDHQRLEFFTEDCKHGEAESS